MLRNTILAVMDPASMGELVSVHSRIIFKAIISSSHLIVIQSNLVCIKELLNKEQTGFKELFTNYQPFYTINQRVLNRLSKLSEQKLRFFSRVKIKKNAFNKN